MSKWLIVLSLLLPGAAMAATVWMWIDENGQRHYSDRPVEGAQQIEITEAQTFTVPAPAAVPGGAQEPAEPQSGLPYTRFAIAEPQPQQTLWNIEGTLEVTVDLQPGLREGHEIDLYLDGARQYLNARRTTFTIDEVYRGVHTVEAVVLGSSGEEILRTQTRSFVVQQTSLLNPNNPNTSPPGVN